MLPDGDVCKLGRIRVDGGCASRELEGRGLAVLAPAALRSMYTIGSAVGAAIGLWWL